MGKKLKKKYYKLNKGGKQSMIKIFENQVATKLLPQNRSIVQTTRYLNTFESLKINGKVNTILNICPHREEMIIERLGKFHSQKKSGYFFAIPLIDKIKYVVDMRELTIPIDPQSAITKDNVSVELGGNVYIQFDNSYKAAYGAKTPISAVCQHAQSAMRAVVGDMTLDELFHNRNKINKYILSSLADATDPWGIRVLRYEVTSVTTEESIHNAMNKQAAAERQRREDVLHAEAVKRTLELESEGERQKLINESEGSKIDRINDAQGRAESVKLAADAEYYRIIQEANAKAEALEIIGKQLVKDSVGENAARFDLALKYIEEYGRIIGGSNTIILTNNGDQVSNFLAQVLSVYNEIKKK